MDSGNCLVGGGPELHYLQFKGKPYIHLNVSVFEKIHIKKGMSWTIKGFITLFILITSYVCRIRIITNFQTKRFVVTSFSLSLMMFTNILFFSRLNDNKRSHDPVDYACIDSTELRAGDEILTGKLNYNKLENMYEESHQISQR